MTTYTIFSTLYPKTVQGDQTTLRLEVDLEEKPSNLAAFATGKAVLSEGSVPSEEIFDILPATRLNEVNLRLRNTDKQWLLSCWPEELQVEHYLNLRRGEEPKFRIWRLTP